MTLSPTSSPKNEDVPMLTPKQPPKTPLKKEDLEKIAKQLKRKLSKASIAAKQSLSPTMRTSPQSRHTSPLKNFMTRKLRDLSGLGGSLPYLGSPNGKSPTQMKTPAAVFLSSSPLKNMTAADTTNDSDMLDSPTRRGADASSFHDSPISFKGDSASTSPTKLEPQMILQSLGPQHLHQQQQQLLHQQQQQQQPPRTPPKAFASVLKPSPNLQTTPTLEKKQLATTANNLLRTPTQAGPVPASNENEGADLLMYLATSPSPAKPPPAIYGTTPRGTQTLHKSGSNNPSSTSNNSFIAPAPPLTPKRPIVTTARTPQNRLTPLVNLFNNGNNNGNVANGLPSSGLMLTPAGFNMSDYFNFFTPLPGGGNSSGMTGPHGLPKNFLKTPDFNGHHVNSNINNVTKQKVDGKMINFDKVGLFGNNPEPKNDN